MKTIKKPLVGLIGLIAICGGICVGLLWLFSLTDMGFVAQVYGSEAWANYNIWGRAYTLKCPRPIIIDESILNLFFPPPPECRLTNPLPPEIGQLIKLRFLGIRSSQFTIIPPEIGQLQNLDELSLEGNFTTVPVEIGQLQRLEGLWLTGNFTSLPPEIGKLQKLKWLIIKSDHLKTLPPEIGQLTQLEDLRVFGNNLETIPSEIGQLSNLEELWLRDTSLVTLPDSIGYMSHLKYVMIDGTVAKSPQIEQLREAGVGINCLGHDGCGDNQ